MGCNTSKDAIKAVEAAATAADNTAEELADSVEDKVAELFEGRPLDFAGFQNLFVRYTLVCNNYNSNIRMLR